MDSQVEVQLLFNKLTSWKEASQREFSNIINSYSSRIKQGVLNLTEEVCDLRSKLTIITEERNKLLDEVENLSGEILQVKDKLPNAHLSDPDENHDRIVQKVGTVVSEFLESTDARGKGYSTDIDQDGHVDHENVQEMVNPLVKGAKNQQSKTTNNMKKKDMRCHQDPPHSKDHSCPQCNFAFFNEDLKIHMTNAYLKLEPTENVEFVGQKDHLRISDVKSMEDTSHKTGDGQFKCEHCPYVSTYKSKFKRHFKAVHEKIRNHVCEECGYAAAENSMLKRHIKSVHMNIRNHSCEECGYAASEKRMLKRHIEAVHKKIKNHYCEECRYAASDQYTVKRHMQTVHKIGNL